MKTASLALATTLLLCTPLLASAAPASGLTPEQTFDLYARTLLEDDASAARTLNEALRPAFDGKDALTPSPRGLATALATPLREVLAKQGGATLGTDLVEVYAANLARTECRARSSKIRTSDYVEGQKLADIAFTCQVTDLASVRPLFNAGLQDNSAANLKRFIDAYTALLRTGPRRELAGTITLYPGKGEGYWYSGNLDDLLGPVLGAAAPFEAWSQDALAEQAPKVTGVPACDLLLQQHRQCIARTAPDQLTGVEVMADELTSKAKLSTPEAMTQECKALRSMAEAMWGDDCG